MSERRVVISGMGVISPVGNDLESFWESLKAGRSGITRYKAFDSEKFDSKIAGEVRDFEPTRYFKTPKDVKRTDRYTQLAVAAAQGQAVLRTPSVRQVSGRQRSQCARSTLRWLRHLLLMPPRRTLRLTRQSQPHLLPAPPTYYQGLRDRLSQAPELEWQDAEMQCLIENQILVDWQPGLPESVLLQIFSLPILPNSLFFFEFIERRGQQAQGFGERNFQALYEAVEADLQSR